MQVSKLDPCLFVDDQGKTVAFVDDILFWSMDQVYTNKLGSKLREQGLILEQEFDAAGYFGVKMTKTEDGHIEMKQTGLIDRVIEALGLDSKLSTSKCTPAEAMPLTYDKNSESPKGSFSYSSVIGMLLYLLGHSRPNIANAVNCCARCMLNSCVSHEKALKQIGRYLKATMDKGLVLHPSGQLKIDAYPDADFAGSYWHEKDTNPACSKRHTGFLLTVSCLEPLFS